MFELGNAYVCEKAVGPDKTCDFRSGRTILQRPIERAQMQKLLAAKKTDLLQFVSARTRRPFSAFLVRAEGRQGRLRVRGEGSAQGARAAQRGAAHCACWARIPRTSKPVELYAGRYGPYVKHGGVNATVPDRDQVDALTLDEAVKLLAAKAGAAGERLRARRCRRGRCRHASGRTSAREDAGETAAKAAAKPVAKPAARKPAAKKPPARKPARRHAQAHLTAPSRYAALDGLRGFAVLLVFCVHAAGNTAAVVLRRRLRAHATSRRSRAIGERLLFWLFRSHHGVFLFFVLVADFLNRPRMWAWPQPGR